MKDWANESSLTYRHHIRPLVIQGIPEIRCGYLVKDNSTFPPTFRHELGLKEVPAKLFNLRPHDEQELLRLVKKSI